MSDVDAGLKPSYAPAWMGWLMAIAVASALLAALAVLMGPMDERVAAPGVVRPREYALVFPPPGGGVIQEVTGMPGGAVKAGDLLATLESDALRHEREALAHDLVRAESELADARAHEAAVAIAPISPEIAMQAAAAERLEAMAAERRRLVERMEQGGEGRAISLIELVRERMALQSLELERDRARAAAVLTAGPFGTAQRAMAAARVAATLAVTEGMRARLATLAEDLARHEIRAPVDGLLVSRSVRFPGEKALAGQALFKIARGTGVRLRLYAGEDRVGRIHPGMRVVFRPKSDPDRLRPLRSGAVTAVAPDRDLAADEADRPAVGSYAIDVDLTGDTADLPFGSTVDAEIILAKRPFWELLVRQRR